MDCVKTVSNPFLKAEKTAETVAITGFWQIHHYKYAQNCNLGYTEVTIVAPQGFPTLKNFSGAALRQLCATQNSPYRTDFINLPPLCPFRIFINSSPVIVSSSYRNLANSSSFSRFSYRIAAFSCCFFTSSTTWRSIFACVSAEQARANR